MAASALLQRAQLHDAQMRVQLAQLHLLELQAVDVAFVERAKRNAVLEEAARVVEKCEYAADIARRVRELMV